MKKATGLLFLALMGVWFLAWANDPPPSSLDPKTVPILTVSGSINPGTTGYVIRGIDEAQEAGAPFVVIHLDTPGGLLSSTREVVKAMLNSRIPIVVFVGPRGAHAGSAGAIITFAADVAAMAPGTNIGAAHPVVPGNEKVDETMKAKMANDTAAFAQSLAKSKGRNVEWAAKAVRDSASLIAEEALKRNVVDLMADDVPDLLRKLEGHKLNVAKGSVTELPPAVLSGQEIEMSMKHRMVAFFADPNLAYMIMSLGGLCIWVELSNPGLIVPGVVGVICILLSLISFQLLPISYGALGFILVGLMMVVGELFLPTYGLLGLAGIAAFIFGSLFLMDTPSPEFQISLSLILPTAAVLAGSAVLLGWLIVKSRGRRLRSGTEAMVGEFGRVRETVSTDAGRVFVQGELWSARSVDPIEEGELVVVEEVNGMNLKVKRQG